MTKDAESSVVVELLCVHCRAPQPNHGPDGKCLFSATHFQASDSLGIVITIGNQQITGVRMSDKEGLHSKLERGIKHIEKKIEGAVSKLETVVDGPKFAVGVRVRSIVDYRRGQEGVIMEIDPENDRYTVGIETTFNGAPGVVDCNFEPRELERVL